MHLNRKNISFQHLAKTDGDESFEKHLFCSPVPALVQEVGGTFSQPGFNRTFSNCLLVLPEDDRTDSVESMLDHDFGNSGHSDSGNFQ